MGRLSGYVETGVVFISEYTTAFDGIAAIESEDMSAIRVGL